MAKDAIVAATPESATTDAPTDFPLTAEEFCMRLSSEDRRVELIAGFFHSEKLAGRMHRDTHANFQARFEEFANKPA